MLPSRQCGRFKSTVARHTICKADCNLFYQIKCEAPFAMVQEELSLSGLLLKLNYYAVSCNMFFFTPVVEMTILCLARIITWRNYEILLCNYLQLRPSLITILKSSIYYTPIAYCGITRVSEKLNAGRPNGDFCLATDAHIVAEAVVLIRWIVQGDYWFQRLKKNAQWPFCRV